MVRLPTVGGDSGTWGTVLNDYLTQNINFHYTLSTATAAGATTLTLDRTATGLVEDGSYIAIGATTTKCEVRRVMAISGADLTLDFALAYAHSGGDFAWVLQSTWIPPEWFGCKALESTIDNSAGFMQAFIDHAAGARFGLTGHFARYYVSTPLCMYDNMRLEQIALTVKTPLSIDPMIGERNGEPDQFFATLAGQFGTVTAVDTGTNELTLSTSPGTTVGDRLIFYARQGDTLPAPLEDGRAYYILSNSGLDFKISVDKSGAEVDLTTSGTGTPVFFSTGGARMRWDDVTFEGVSTQGLNGLIAFMQQPSVARNLKMEGFPGPKGTACFGGQQADFYTPMFLDGHIGLNLQAAQFMYFYGGSYEDCDILVQTDSVDLQGNNAGCRNNSFFGGHYETIGIQTALVQTLMGNAAVSAGTFTLSFGGQTTAAIAFDASAATIQTELEALSTIDPGDVTVTNEAGALPSGRMRLTFSGQYAWKVMTGTNRTTVNSGGLTGGTYSMNYVDPNGRSTSITDGCAGLFITGAIISTGEIKPDGTGMDFLTVESTSDTLCGYQLISIVSGGQGGNAVYDIPRAITIPWADATAGERLAYYSAAGRHGGTEAVNWYLAGRLGGHIAWSEYDEQLRIRPTASLVLGDGTPIKRLTTGVTASVADGGTITHNLGATPDLVLVTPSVSGEFVSVTAIGATTFTVAIKKHDGSAGTTQTLYWEAKDI